MRALSLASLVVAALQLTSIAPARAETPPRAEDAIQLKNGGELRGSLIDVVPGVHARIQLATGEVATIPWSEIARVDSARRGPAPKAEPQRRVHIEAPREVALERQTDNPKIWTLVCTSPCDRTVPASGNYRIGGSGVRASRPFALDAGSDDRVFIDVEPGSKGWFVGGIIMTSVGGGALIVGLVLALVGSVASDVSKHDNGLTAAGYTTAAVGTITMVGGLVALVSNSSSNVLIASTPPQPQQPEAKPVWSAPAIATPAPFLVPVIAGVF